MLADRTHDFRSALVYRVERQEVVVLIAVVGHGRSGDKSDVNEHASRLLRQRVLR
jgi:hypothetical protein